MSMSDEPAGSSICAGTGEVTIRGVWRGCEDPGTGPSESEEGYDGLRLTGTSLVGPPPGAAGLANVADGAAVEPGRPLLVIMGLDVGRRVGREERPDAFGALGAGRSDLPSASACKLRRVRKVGMRLGGGMEVEAEVEGGFELDCRCSGAKTAASGLLTSTSIPALGAVLFDGRSSTGVVDRGPCLSATFWAATGVDRIGDPVRNVPMDRREGETGAGLVRKMPFARLGETNCVGAAAGDLCTAGTRAKGRVVCRREGEGCTTPG